MIDVEVCFLVKLCFASGCDDDGRSHSSCVTLLIFRGFQITVLSKHWQSGKQHVSCEEVIEQSWVYFKVSNSPSKFRMVTALVHAHIFRTSVEQLYTLSTHLCIYSLCKTTMTPINPSITCLSHGCSLSRIVTYPTKGMNPTTLPTTSSLRLRNDWPVA